MWLTAVSCARRYCLLDFTIEYRTQSVNDSFLFLRIKSAIYGLQASIVYIRGLLRVSDTLWKWCAEFTQRHPWVFIFFEDTDTSWLLPENLDRCIDELAGHADRNTYIASLGSGREVDTTLQPVVYEDIGVPVMKPDFFMEDTRLNDAWEAEFNEADFLASKASIVVTGPAGIGKSYFIKHGFLCRPAIASEFFQVTKDGSNYEFLSSTVGDVLQHEVVERRQEVQNADNIDNAMGPYVPSASHRTGSTSHNRVLLVIDECVALCSACCVVWPASCLVLAHAGTT